LRSYREFERLEQALLHGNFIMTTSNVVFRRQLLLRTGGFRPLRYVHDLDFLLRLSSLGELGFVEKELVRYRIHGGNTIAETRRDRRRMVYELGWILADRIQRYLASAHTPDEIQDYVSGLVGSLPTHVDSLSREEIAAVATVLLPLRFAVEASRLQDQAADYASSLLAEDHPTFKAVHALDLDRRSRYIGDLRNAIADLDESKALLQQVLEKEIAWRTETQQALEKELAWRKETQQTLEKELAWRKETQQTLEKKLARRRNHTTP
jgi:hypothetical protein